MHKPWIYIASGRNRAVYKHGNFVIKVPVNEYGVADNEIEASRWRRFGRENNLARCRLIPGTTLLVMEFVMFPNDYKNLPDWTNYVDCRQVGYNLNGRLVAYDYGYY